MKNPIKKLVEAMSPSSSKKETIMYISGDEVSRKWTVRCKCGAVFNINPTRDVSRKDSEDADKHHVDATWWSARCPHCGKNHYAYQECHFYGPD